MRSFLSPGWSSNVQMSNDTDTRVVACRYEMPATSALSNAGVVVPFSVKIFDTHSAMSAGTFTCPVSGIYRLSAHIVTNPFASGAVTRQCIATVRKNTSTYCLLDIQVTKSTTSMIQTLSGSCDVQANAGDTLDLFWTSDDGSIVSNSAQNYSHISIERLSGPAVVATTETVSAKYYASGNTTSTTTTPINYDTRVYDTHGAVTAGASWKFTAPVSGRYRISTFNNSASGTNSTFLALYKNGTKYESFIYSPAVNTNLLFGATEIFLNAGDYIDLRCTTSTAVSGNATQSGDTASHVEITRIGL
jgi:hypothetical protein